MTTETWVIIAALAVVVVGLWVRGLIEHIKVRSTWDLKPMWANGGKAAVTEFKTLEEMTPEELVFERQQSWSILKSDTTWWICRNEVPYLPLHGDERFNKARDLFNRYGLVCAFIDDRQGPTKAEDFVALRQSKGSL